MGKIVIAIDGYSGTGKSSTARAVAESLQYKYIDSGAMYRGVTLYFLNNEVDLTDKEDVLIALDEIEIGFQINQQINRSEVVLNGIGVEDKIRLPRINENVSEVSAISEVRKKMVARQHEFGTAKGIVMDGRDIGTVVFPDAELKIFMTTDTMVRAVRRQQELKENGVVLSLDEIARNLEERDHLDTTRTDSPLKKAEDAIEIDTTNQTFERQVQSILQLAKIEMNED
jgi:cytidylate kinase